MEQFNVFSMGALYQTTGIMYAMKANKNFANEIAQCLKRYSHGDWGEICGADIEINEEAVKNNGRIIALYYTMLGSVLVSTEPERKFTTISFASEY